MTSIVNFFPVILVALGALASFVVEPFIKDENKQQRIKEAMVRLILRDGIDGISVAKIAREAGVSPATIYVYYDSKEEMLAEVCREYSTAPYRYLMQRVSADMDGSTLIETIVRGCYSFSREHEEIFSFVEQCSRCPTLSERVSEERRDRRGEEISDVHEGLLQRHRGRAETVVRDR